MPNDDYYSEFSGSQIDTLLKKARDAEKYAQRAERALVAVEEVAHLAKQVLEQIQKNMISLGMQKINCWYVEDGNISKQPAAVVPPSIMSMIGDHKAGKITCIINNAPAGEQTEQYCAAVLSETGDVPQSVATIMPGKYKLSYAVSGLPTGCESVIWADVYSTEDDYERYYAYKNEPVEFVIPDNFYEVVIFAKVSTEYPEAAVSGNVKIYPFLRPAAITNGFEPYKPDLQTQIRQSGGGYNEVKTESFTDNVQEVTT